MDKRKILVVDDESRMRKLVRDFLTKQNFEVLEAGDGSLSLPVPAKVSTTASSAVDSPLSWSSAASSSWDGWTCAMMDSGS